MMDGNGGISINMPCAPMPMPEGDAPAFMHNRPVTSLTGNSALLYQRRSHISPDQEGTFLESQAPAIHQAVLKYRLHIDAVDSAYLNKMDKIDCGWTAPLPRLHHYGGATGFHTSLGIFG